MPIVPEILAHLANLRSEDSFSPLPSGKPLAVIDTNVLLDIWHFRDPEAVPLQELALEGHFVCLRDEATENEFAEVIHRAQFGISLPDQKRILGEWHSLAIPVRDVSPSRIPCRDPLDQKFLDLAASAGASLLITKDRHLLKAARRAKRDGILVLLPGAATEWLRSVGFGFPG